MALLASVAAQYSGQTVVDGVMMRGRRAMSIAVREPNGWVATRSVPTTERRLAVVRRLPLLRGLLAMVEALWLVVGALHWSSGVSRGRRQGFNLSQLALPALSLALTAILFIAAPSLARGWLPAGLPAALGVVTELTMRSGLVAAYVWFVVRGPGLQHALSYHAAEHQALSAYERGVELSVEAVKGSPAAHCRCSIGFLLLTGCVAMLTLPLLPSGNVWIHTFAGLLLVPALAAVGFEAWRLVDVRESSRAGALLTRPISWLQRLTTREPADAHLEVAVAALQGVIEFEAIVSEPVSRAVALLQPEHE